MASSKEEAKVSSQPGTPKIAEEQGAKTVPAKKVSCKMLNVILASSVQ